MANSDQPRGNPSNKILIDATHPEETRVVVLRHGRVEEFDYESAARKLLRGNIYLAKVTRVEPSLQAAFVDYGGNRHGFLAFNEIHPDYYQIPVADRRALIEADAAAEAEEEEEADRAAEAAARRRRRRPADEDGGSEEDDAVDVTGLLPHEDGDADGDDGAGRRDSRADGDEHDGEPSERARTMAEPATGSDVVREDVPADQASDSDYPASRGHEPVRPAEYETDEAGSRAAGEGETGDADAVEDTPQPVGLVEDIGVTEIDASENGNGVEPEQVETVAAEDALEELPVRPRRRQRSYKIQEVTKRRQVILVQVVKEERGTKGAALTTYLSLAGRYTVLMPNTARGGGISRKITNAQDRKRLKAIAAELDVPEGMGLIIRTAGASRTKQEIKRDYEYLLRLWESVRELALGSNAPTLVYEEGNLIKRSIRDLYGKDVDEIVVSGDVAYREAKDFMRMLMPSHAKNVIAYDQPEQLFSRYQIERQLNAMFSPYVHLRSGGYLVINQTEALVAIDINSGKSTREFSIEETALSTNMEAAEEIARQLRLRDLAGLIVIDFIDMDEKRNNRAVERRLKDALRFDRARIQVGRISHFGLLEMSRQRMRTGVLEGSTTQCPHCQGTGIIRSTESVALAVLRGLEDSLMSGQPASLVATTTATVALYILNNKRVFINEMEQRYGVSIHIVNSDKIQGANFTIERLARREEPLRRQDRTAVNMDWGFEDEDAEAAGEAEEVAGADGEGGPGGDGRRRKRRRRRGRRDEQGGGAMQQRGGGAPRQALDDDDDEQSDDGGSHYVEAGGNGRSPDDDDDEQEYAERDTRSGGSDEREAADGEGNGERRSRRGRRRGRRGGRRGQERGRGETGQAFDDEAAQGGAEELAARPGDQTDGDGDGDGGQPIHVAAPGSGDEPAVTAIAVAAFERAEVEKVAEMPQDMRGEEREGTNGAAMFEQAAEAPDAVEPAGSAAAPSIEVSSELVMAQADEPARSEPAVAESATRGGAEEAPRSPRTAPVASEPVLARVMVGPGKAESESEDAKPARRGWWQRR